MNKIYGFETEYSYIDKILPLNIFRWYMRYMVVHGQICLQRSKTTMECTCPDPNANPNHNPNPNLNPNPNHNPNPKANPVVVAV